MKICATQGLILMLAFSLAIAHDNDAQILEKKITINVVNVQIEDALKEIEEVAGVRIFYSIDQMALQNPVTVKGNDVTLRSVLDNLLKPFNISYSVDEKDGTISLKRIQGTGKHNEETKSVKLPYQISGTVKDDSTGVALAGVNIIVRGTTNGTATNTDGKFVLQAEADDVLVFTFIGYKPITVSVNGRTLIDVLLKEETAALGEVVIRAGYYDVDNRERTGNIAKVSAKDISSQPVSNPLAALQGRVAGLEVTQQTGVPGGNYKVRIRGTNSISNGNDPLYIVDGVPYTSTSMSFLETSGGILGNPNSVASQGSSPLNSINPSDIESIEVLKDADATSIYGSRGSNGVILITTKRGASGKTKVDFNMYSGVANVAHQVKLLSTPQFLSMRHEAFRNDGITPTSDVAPDLLSWDTTRYTNWQKKLIGGTARTTDGQLNISGGEANTQFSVGTGYHKETSVFPGSNSSERVSTHLSLTNTSLNQKLKTTISLNYSVNTSDMISQDLTSQALSLAPDAPALYNMAGSINRQQWSANYENPLAFLNRKYKSNTSNLIANAVLSYSLTKNLTFKSNFGYTRNTSKATTLIPISSLDSISALSAQNQSNFTNSDFNNWIIEPQAMWKSKIGSGNFDALAGSTFLSQTSEGLAQTGTGYVSEALMTNLAAAAVRTVGTNFYSQYKYAAIFTRINYALNGKYIVNLTGRRDGSSRFGPGKKFANFGAIGAAWIFSDEDFVKSGVPFLAFGKLRSSYGITGNDQLGDYQYLNAYTITGTGIYQGISSLTPARLSNPNFAWETNRKLEFALELGFLERRINASFSYYRNRSSNQLVGFPLPLTTGFNSIQGNFPATVQNKGLEIEINTRNIESGDFKWSTSLNMTIPQNRLVAFPNLNAFADYAYKYVVGQPLGIQKLYQFTGLNPASGVYTFKDTNGDGSLDFRDQQTLRFVGSKFYGGIQNSFSYKTFRLDIFFQYNKQTGFQQLWGVPGSSFSNQGTSVLARWQKEGDHTEVPKASTQNSFESSLFYQSDRAVTDASFIRLKNVSLSYSLPTTVSQKLHMSNARFYVQGQNMLTWTNYKGLDPETQNVPSLPPLRTITAGFQFTL